MGVDFSSRNNFPNLASFTKVFVSVESTIPCFKEEMLQSCPHHRLTIPAFLTVRVFREGIGNISNHFEFTLSLSGLLLIFNFHEANAIPFQFLFRLVT